MSSPAQLLEATEVARCWNPPVLGPVGGEDSAPVSAEQWYYSEQAEQLEQPYFWTAVVKSHEVTAPMP